VFPSRARQQAACDTPRPAFHGAHQLESVAARHHAGPELIVEADLAAFQVILEVHIQGVSVERPGDARQRQVVRGHQADGSALHQAAHQRLGANAAIMRVGTTQQLGEQKQAVCSKGKDPRRGTGGRGRAR